MTVYLSEQNKYADSAAFVAAAYLRAFSAPAPAVLRTEKGKPYFESGPHFSVSHSGGLIACVFHDREIGLDIQKIKSISDKVTRIYLGGTFPTPEAQTEAWTRYESCGKRRGTGVPLSSPPDGCFASARRGDVIITVNTEHDTDGIEIEEI